MNDMRAYVPDGPAKDRRPAAPARTAVLGGRQVPRGVAGEARPAAGPPGEEDYCLLVTRDDGLADHIALVAAASGAVLQVAPDIPGRLPQECGIVLLGSDAVRSGTYGRLPVPVIMAGFAGDSADLWKSAARNPGARVAVLPAASAWLGEFLGERGLHAGRGRVTVVAGMVGGAGTTTLAVLAAIGAGLRGARSLLIDADPHSPGMWPVLAPGRRDSVGWEDLVRSRGQIAPGHLAEILPLVQGTAVLTWACPPGAGRAASPLNEVISAARRTYDVVLVDAGRTAGLGESLLSLADAAIAVTTARSAAGASAAGLGGMDIPWRLAVTGRLPAGVDADRVARSAGVGVLAYVPPSPGIAAAAREGRLGSAWGQRRTRRRMEPVTSWCLERFAADESTSAAAS